MEEQKPARGRGRTRGGAGLAAWGVFGLLFGALFAGVATFDRAGRPGLVGDEATYAMQAASLAFDLDLRYTRADYDRFVAQWGGPPDGLILQSRDDGARITYGKPPLYALAAAPFVRFAPVRGALLANVVLLALAAALAARVLRIQVGTAAPLWVACFLFASVAFGYAFWVHADLFLLACAAAGFALVYEGERARHGPLPEIYDGEELAGGTRSTLRWAAAGALLAIPAAYRPFYLALLIPALLAALAARARGRQAAAALLAGALLLLAATAGAQWLAGGSWSGYGGERQGFYPRTGYPEVDFPASDWPASVRRWGNTSWLQEGALEARFDPKLAAWNGLYFLAGENVGVLPYFLPLVLGFLAYRGDRGRWAIVPAVALAALGLLLVRPFNFYGGGGALANRYFLPLYPALWFLVARPRRAGWVAAVAALAAPFLWPLWAHPRAFPVGEDGRYAYVSELARRLLPYETTQSHLPGGRDVTHHGLWVKSLTPAVGPVGGGRSLRLSAGGPGELLVGSPEPLEAVVLRFGGGAPTRIEIEGGEIGGRMFGADGSIAFALRLDRPRAVHPMWWTRDDVHLYRIGLRLPAGAAPVGLRITPGSDLVQRAAR
ncbi:MAG TPA: hypothetical protein VF121_02180 [Thermoanaerobaculia bacterium]|nr:hypothetical protein [Thermoanaerobaculia bacterium]